MYKYKINESGTKVIFYKQNNFLFSFIDGSVENTDYQEYLKWVEEGNIAEEIDLGEV
jgi:hypothetical protein